MWQFIHGSDAAFSTLEARARRSCVRFRNQEMPPGATPRRATIGFEIDASSGMARLLIDRGVSYTGPSDDLRRWFESGQRSFESFAALRSWIATKLRAAFLPAVAILPTVAVPPMVAVELEDDSEDGSDLGLDDLDSKWLQIALRRGGQKKDLPS